VPQRLDRPWRREDPDRYRQKGWKRQEDRAATVQPGGHRQPGSGNQPGASRKGDGRGDYLLVSAKTTSGKSIRVERGWLEAVVQQARAVRRVPALYFGFDSKGAGREDWLAVPDRAARRAFEVVEAVLEGDYGRAEEAAQMFLLG